MLKIRRGYRHEFIFLDILLCLILLGSMVYAISYYGISSENKVAPKVLNLFTISAMTLALVTFFIRRPILLSHPVVNPFSILIMYLLGVSIISNSPIEYLPSLLRYSTYYLSALYVYWLLEKRGVNFFGERLSYYIKWSIVILIFFGLLEVLINDVEYLNGAYRFSGSFKRHPLGNSMFLLISIFLYAEAILIPRKRIIDFFVLGILVYLFINTHSRLPLVLLFFSYSAYFFLKSDSLSKKIKILIAIGVVGSGLVLLIINTEINPRMRFLILSQLSLQDNSTLERVYILEQTYNSMSTLQKWIGIGLGGFNNFYIDITNDPDGAAAHNNFLLFFAEGGYIGLGLFLVFQWVLIRILLKISKINFVIDNINYSRLLFVSISSFEIGSFLLNNYYFYCSEILVWMLIGVYIYIDKSKNQNVK